LSFIHTDDLDFVKKSVDSALKNKEKYSVEHKIIRKDDNERFVKQRAEVIYNASDNPIRMIGTIQDITEDKKKEDRLYKQEKELRSRAELIDLAYDMIIVHNLDGKITFWNNGAEKIYGFKREEVLGKVTHEVLKTKYSEPLLKIISAVLTSGTWEGQMIHKTKNGKQIIVESRWALQKNEQGKPFAVIEIDRDISKRKSAEKKTEEARKYAESIIETIQEALVVLDAKLTVLSANNAFYRLFKLKPDQTEGKFIYELDQNQWDIPELRNFLEDILTKNTSFEAYEMDYLPLKGLTKVLSLNARRIYRGKKKTEMILLAMQDITTRKQQERRIRELTEELLFVEEEQRQAVATNLHDSIGQLLAFSKKEIAMILKEPKMRTDDSLKKILDSIQKSIEQSRKLTADLSSPTLHTFGLQAGLEELAEQFSNENEIKCSFRAAQENIRIEKKNELLLYRSVKELLCNIVKHAKAKSVKIELGISSSFLELKVVDDGKGFDVSHLNKNNTKKKSLGLFSIEQRLKNIGGSFNIESEKKKGTKVILRVPLKKT
jgi:PAS domain S-box-containing protein